MSNTVAGSLERGHQFDQQDDVLWLLFFLWWWEFKLL
jgi:hypothetical protein